MLVQSPGGRQRQFSYGPDHQRWRQVANYANGTETTHYVGALLEKESTTTNGLTHWRHYVPTPGGHTVVLSRDSAGRGATNYVLADHLGSSDTLLDGSGALLSRLSYDAFGARRGADWRAGTSPDWTRIAATTRQGFTGHEMLDNVGLVHMGGRIYDPGLGRFLSVDPVVGDLRDPQIGNPYGYVGNRPLSDTDSTGLSPDGCASVCGPIVYGLVRTAANFLFGGAEIWRPGATAIPGQSAQGDGAICGAGTFSPVCAGTVLYAGAPPTGIEGGPGSSSWITARYESEIQFFIDLGKNALDVLILSPYHGLEDSNRAAKDGEYVEAAVLLSMAVCEVAKPCNALKAPVKAIAKLESAGGVKRKFVQASEKVFYRVYSENRLGKWVTAVPPRSRAWAREALSLPPANKATYVQEVRVPAGTRMERSRATPVPEWGRTRGGAEQFELLDEIPPSSFGDGLPLE